MFYYKIATGEFLHENEFWGTGYSGAGLTSSEGRNNQYMCADIGRGPIPPGKYKIMRPSYTHPIEGPIVFNLQPSLGTNDFGRSGFHIHGNNARNDASQGCIILGPAIRKEIDTSEDCDLMVTAT